MNDRQITLEKRVLKTIEEHDLIRPGQHIVLGLSGGPDSVCLFHVLLKLGEERNWTVHAVHVNHMLRPGAAEKDQNYTRELCRRNGVSCRTFVFDCGAVAKAEKLTSEEAGRRVRYQAFADVAAELRKQGVAAEDICIAVAHNADDQAETILFRLLRGAGLDGLSGMRYLRSDEEGNRIVRPLLDVYKEQILEYCRTRCLSPCLDHTNDEPIYTRNRLRLSLIPQLEKEYNPAIRDTLIRMGKSAAQDSDCLRKQAEEAFRSMVLSQDETGVVLQGEVLRSCHKAVRTRVLIRAFADLGLSSDLTFVHLENCETVIFHQGASAACDLPKGFYLERIYGDVKAGKREPLTEFRKQLRLPSLKVGVFEIDEYRRKKDSCMERHSEDCCVFDYEAMERRFGEGFENHIAAGYRRSGDVIAIDSGHFKKIQDLFVDQKIPKEQRDLIPMVKIGREVLRVIPWNCRGRYSAEYKVGKTTKKVICIEIICEI